MSKSKKKKNSERNYTYIAMMKRYGKTTKTIENKKDKKKNKDFWKKDWESFSLLKCA